MNWFWWISGVLVALIWVRHVVSGALGMRHVVNLSGQEWDRVPASAPSVSIVVPARNEAVKIGEALHSLMALDYPNYEVIAIDDRSIDATGEIMEEVAREPQSRGRLRVMHITDLPAGWLGKTWAMWRAAAESKAQWVLFTDADIVFRADSLRRAIAYAESEQADHLVLFPTMEFKSWGERMILAFFQIKFGFGHKPWKVADPRSKEHVGMGAFNLVRRSVYEAIGTYERLRLAVIDDLKLGEVIKHSGYAQRCAFGPGLISIHWARGLFGVLHNLTKNLFAVLRFRWPLAILAVIFVLFVNVLPFAGVIFAHGWQKTGFAVALVSIVLIYVNIARQEDVPARFVLLHPLAAVLFGYAILRSAFVTLKDGGVTWRGTKYGLQELRKDMQ